MADLPDGTTVLVVDDDESVLDLFESWLDGHATVRTATSGCDGLDALDASVDVVLLDRQMPGVSGEAVLARIDEHGSGCRVALVTGVAPDFDVLDLGFDDYLEKPVRRDVVVSTVRRLAVRADYDESLREYFAAVRKRELLSAEKSRAELADSEAYHELEAQIDALRSRVNRTVDDLDPQDFEVLFHDFRPVPVGATQ